MKSVDWLGLFYIGLYIFDDVPSYLSSVLIQSNGIYIVKNNCDHFVSRLCLELPVLQPRSDGGEDGRQRGAGPGRPHHRGQWDIKY